MDPGHIVPGSVWEPVKARPARDGIMKPEILKTVPHVEEPLFLQLFDVSPIPAVVTRLRDHTVLAVNRRTSELFGVSQEDAVGLRTIDYYVNPVEQQELV